MWRESRRLSCNARPRTLAGPAASVSHRCGRPEAVARDREQQRRILHQACGFAGVDSVIRHQWFDGTRPALDAVGTVRIVIGTPHRWRRPEHDAVASDIVAHGIRKAGNGESNRGSVRRRPRWVRRRGDRTARMERGLARNRPVEEEPGLAIQSTRQILERRPSRRRASAIEPSPSTESHNVVSFGQDDQARPQADPCLGDRARNSGPRQRSHSKRGGTAVQPEAPLVGAGAHQASAAAP